MLGMAFQKNKPEVLSWFDFSKSAPVSLENSAPNITLIVSEESKAKLDNFQKLALEDNFLKDEYKVEVPATLINLKDTFLVSIRLKGDYSDHWKDEKRSYRVKMKGDDRFLGMKSFSIQSPTTRQNMSEWYFHKLMQEAGLIALRYQFMNLTENGKNKGIYAVEESFSKDLIEHNNRREAPILKFDESILIDPTVINANGTLNQENLFQIAKVDVFKAKKTLKNPTLYDQYLKAQTLLKKVRRGDITASQAFDIEKAAKLFAIADITGGHHALRWKNVRFYYNPVLSKLELIGFDSNSGYTLPNVYYYSWYDNKLGTYDVKKWKDIFFKDPVFVAAYFNALKQFSNPTYLREFHKKIQAEIDLTKSYLANEFPDYEFSTWYYTKNSEMIRGQVKKFEAMQKINNNKYFYNCQAINALKTGQKSISISIVNSNLNPITLLGIYNKQKALLSEVKHTLIKGRNFDQFPEVQKATFKFKAILDANLTVVSRKDNMWKYKNLKLGILSEGDTLMINIGKFQDPNLNFNQDEISLDTSIFDINHSTKNVTVKHGNWVFTNDIIIPIGYDMVCTAGTTLRLNQNAKIVVNGQLNCQGTASNPITIKSNDQSGTVIVYQSNGTSKITYTNFIGLTESYAGDWHVSGAVNFYEADIILDQVNFSDNTSEDMLNIVRSKFTLSHSTFNNVMSDAFDGDFCAGTIDDISFDQIGNDALDFSGSQIEINNVKMSNISDKGISAGENSHIICNNIEINNCELGLVSKDLSSLKVTKATLNAVAVPYTVFQKKGVFGPASIELVDFNAIDFEEEYLIERDSKSTVEGLEIQSNYDNVAEMLYGELYGKSSR